MKTFAAVVISFLVFPVASAQAEWHAGPGIAYVSKINDVVDIYKANLRAQHKNVDNDKPLPIGVAVDVHDQLDNGLRIGFGVGPYLRLSGAVSHFEIPINGTIGYTFTPDQSTSAYVKGGIVHHFASGDFYESSQPGVLAAGGVELFRESTFNVTVELSYDASKIKLNLVPIGTTTLRSYETVASVFIKF